MNQMEQTVLPNEKALRLVDAVYQEPPLPIPHDRQVNTSMMPRPSMFE